MGCYINPENCEKEDFLAEHGELIYDVDEFTNNAFFLNFNSILKQNKLPVVLVDNHVFTAAGVCYNEMEFKAFTNPRDGRRRQLFLVNIKDLIDVCPLKTYAPELINFPNFKGDTK